MSWSEIKEQFGSVVEFNLQDLRDCSSVLEDLLDRRGREWEIWAKSQTDGLTEAQASHWFQWNGDEYQKLTETFPQTLRGSMFVACYARVEQLLDALCAFLHGTQAYTVELNEMRDKGVVRARRYLKKVGRVRFPEESQHWADIRMYGKVRNLIVHAGGRLVGNEKNRSDVRTFIAARPRLLGMDDETIQFKKDCCAEVIQTADAFFGELVRSLPGDETA